MSEQFFSDINWQLPWLQPVRTFAASLVAQGEWKHAFNLQMQQRAICNLAGHALHFIPQESLPVGVLYESHIYETGGIPTRENLHDFFNALIWLRFPQIKKVLNQLQAFEIKHRSDNAQRGSQRDAATLFDENAALWICSDAELTRALQQHAWSEIFLHKRALLQQHCEVILFGHALLEKLIHPYKAITAHAWVVPVHADWFNQPELNRWDQIDEVVSQRLRQGFSPRDFTPLPVMGVPGWSEGQNAEFYADTQVFRAKRK